MLPFVSSFQPCLVVLFRAHPLLPLFMSFSLQEVFNHLNHTLHPSPSNPHSLSPEACKSASKYFEVHRQVLTHTLPTPEQTLTLFFGGSSCRRVVAVILQPPLELRSPVIAHPSAKSTADSNCPWALCWDFYGTYFFECSDASPCSYIFSFAHYK